MSIWAIHFLAFLNAVFGILNEKTTHLVNLQKSQTIVFSIKEKTICDLNSGPLEKFWTSALLYHLSYLTIIWHFKCWRLALLKLIPGWTHLWNCYCIFEGLHSIIFFRAPVNSSTPSSFAGSAPCCTTPSSRSTPATSKTLTTGGGGPELASAGRGENLKKLFNMTQRKRKRKSQLSPQLFNQIRHRLYRKRPNSQNSLNHQNSLNSHSHNSYRKQSSG